MTTTITVHGTRKSERAGGLDDGETSQFTIKPGQYDSDVSSPSELVARIDRSAYMRGEWISSLRINQFDMVEHIISQALVENHGNLEAVMQQLAEVGMFSNADAEDLLPIVMQTAKVRDSE